MKGRFQGICGAVLVLGMVGSPWCSPAVAGDGGATSFVTNPPGPGYWLLTADGDSYGYNASAMSTASSVNCVNPTPRYPTESPVTCIGLSADASGDGFWIGEAPTEYNGLGTPGYRGVVSSVGVTSDSANGSSVTYSVSGLNAPVVGVAAAPIGAWLASSDGGVFALGGASFYGSAGGIPLNKPVVGIAATPDGGGYWLVASDGGVFSYGDAQFHGSMGGKSLNAPIVGIAASPNGNGYWEVGADGGVFSFGSATFQGSTGSIRLNKPIVGMASNPDGTGYWLVASDGGVFAYGDAPFLGAATGQPLTFPVIGITSKG